MLLKKVKNIFYSYFVIDFMKKWTFVVLWGKEGDNCFTDTKLGIFKNSFMQR